jgi:putative N6-adenine-specific DNA methylase
MLEKKPIPQKQRPLLPSNKFHLAATTMEGLEEVLSFELKYLGANDIVIKKRAVEFVGDKDLIYKANLRLRTALKVLKPILAFTANDETELYNHAKSYQWDEVFDTKKTFAITSSTHSTIFRHSQYVSLKVKDAIADFFREKYGERPNVDTVAPDIKINIHINEEKCELSLDSSGEILNHRGYREKANLAPINECLAAGMILLSGWNRNCDFVDPMCGSGTIAIEAALIARNIAPGLLREKFGFMNWMDFDKDLYETIYDATIDKIEDFNYKIIASDISKKTLDIAMNNAAIAKVDDTIEFSLADFTTDPRNIENAVVMFNPPYGDRLKTENIEEFYKSIGDSLKKNWNGNVAWLLTANLEALKVVGLSTSRKIKLFNGPLECRLVKYMLYKGSKKAKFKEDEDIEQGS